MHSDVQLTIETKQPTSEAEAWPKVAIIVLNWNGWRDTIECLESLQRLTYPNYQIIVVDNGSTDDSVEKIKAWACGEIPVESKFFEYDPSTKPVQWIEYDRATAEAGGKSSEEAKLQALPPSRKLVLIQTGENLGFAGGNNVGIRHALENSADYTLILNNDTIIEPDAVTVLVEVAKEAGASVVGALIRDALGGKPLFVKSMFPRMLFCSEPQKVVPEERWWPSDRVEGSAMLLCRGLLLERLQSVGHFLDESLFLYCEEIELAFWCRQNYKKSVVTGEAVVYHKNSVSSLREQGKASQFYYLTRNRVIIARRYLDEPLWVAFFVLYSFWRVIRSTLYFSKLRINDGIAILRGLWDGYKGQIKRGQF